MEERKKIETFRYLLLCEKEISSLKLLSSSHFLYIFQIPKSNPPLKKNPEVDPLVNEIPKVDFSVEDSINDMIILPPNL